MDNLNNTLSHIIKSNKVLEKANLLYSINANWPKIVNKDIAQKTFIEKVKNKTLYVLTCSPVWSNQLSMLKRDIIRKLNKNYRYNLKDIRFRTTSLKEINKLKKDITELDPAEEKELKKQLESINIEKIDDLGDNLDSEVEKKLKRIYAKDKVYKKLKEKQGWRKCEICGSFIKTKSNICPVCDSRIYQDKKSTIVKFLRETPWIKFEEFKKIYPEIDESFYYKIKKNYKIELKDGIRTKTFLYLKEKDEKVKNDIKKDIRIYVMIATGLEPHYVNENVIRRKVGKFVYDSIWKKDD